MPQKKPGVQYLLLLLNCVLCISSCAQIDSSETITPVTQTHQHTIGSTAIYITVDEYRSSHNIVFINVHSNEKTATDAARQMLSLYGGTLITINNGDERNIRFNMANNSYSFDPNRMFSRNGLSTSLNLLGKSSVRAINEGVRFAQFVLKLIPDSSLLVALHNNRDDSYSVTDYLKKLKTFATEVYLNKEADPDDFILTTNDSLYTVFKQNNVNAVLQNASAEDDGSLSIYYGKMKKPYINIEAQFGHLEEQMRMIKILLEQQDRD